MPENVPSGVITLVFTDIQGSTQLWERLGDTFRPILDRHNALIRELVDRWGGYEVKSGGDSFMLAFARGTDAVRCAVDIQAALHEESWPNGVDEILVRIGMHTGEPFLGYDPAGRPDYFGPVVNRAARISSAGHGGQTLISAATMEVIQGALGEDVHFEDLGTHRLRGLEDQPENIHAVLHARVPAREFPPIRTAESTRTNLPAQTGTFIGRATEIAELRKLIQRPSTRLVTLLGFGGMGKTRLSLQLGDRSLHDYEHGVWWVEVEEARTADAMFDRIAAALSLSLLPQQSVRQQVLSFLRERELLLILDNTEQMPDAPRGINEILQAAPRVRILVTSRRPLELQLERVVEIQPLPQTDGEVLFVERARSRKADFIITPENSQDISELVRRLEGVPLAIELAAGRIVAMSPREITSRLSERFRILQTRSPELPDRQRALRGAIDWSYDLLTEDDRSLFAQVSVFSGGFTLADAEEVCEAFDVLEGVMELRRQSLLRTETDAATQETRYQMLEYVREYAAEKLQEVGLDADAVHQRHADHFAKFAEKRAVRMRTRGEAQALDELTASVFNLLGALHYTSERDDRRLAPRLALALYQYQYRRGFWTEARESLETGLATLTSPQGDERSLAASLELALAGLLLDQGEREQAARCAETSLRLRREVGEPRGTAEALNMLGLLALDAGDGDRANSLFSESLELLDARDHWRRGLPLHNLARAAASRGEYHEAVRLYGEALQHRRAAGDARGEAETLGNLGVLAHQSKDLAEARERYLDSLKIHRALRDRFGIAVMLTNLGEVAAAEKDESTALTFFSHAARLFSSLQSPYEAYVHEQTALLRGGQDDLAWREVCAAAAMIPWEDRI